MAEASFPVDVLNPGQVFACLGFLEAADALVGDAEGGFDWSDTSKVLFALSAKGQQNPVGAVLEFLATEAPRSWGPIGYSDLPPKKGKSSLKPMRQTTIRTNLRITPLVEREFENLGLQALRDLPSS